jgi:hypothetical protein
MGPPDATVEEVLSAKEIKPRAQKKALLRVHPGVYRVGHGSAAAETRDWSEPQAKGQAQPRARAQLALHDVRQAPLKARDLAPVGVAPAVVAIALVEAPLLGDQFPYAVDQSNSLRTGAAMFRSAVGGGVGRHGADGGNLHPPFQ